MQALLRNWYAKDISTHDMFMYNTQISFSNKLNFFWLFTVGYSYFLSEFNNLFMHKTTKLRNFYCMATYTHP